jgi:hypothetical protein
MNAAVIKSVGIIEDLIIFVLFLNNRNISIHHHRLK